MNEQLWEALILERQTFMYRKRSEKSLTPVQNEYLRTLVRKLQERYNQRELGDELGLSQAAVSGFLLGKQGTSVRVAGRVAALLGWDLEDILRLRNKLPDRYPNRAKALEFARSLQREYLPEAIELVADMDRSADDLPVRQWLEMLGAWDAKMRKGELLWRPLPDPDRHG